MTGTLESQYDDFLDAVDVDDIKYLSELTDDMGLKDAFWQLYQLSKSVLDYFGRNELTDDTKLGLYSLIYHLVEIKDEYEERLEKNDDLLCRLNSFLDNVPESFFNAIYDDDFKPLEINITPIHVYKKRAIDYARSIQSDYENQFKGKPIGELDIMHCKERLSIICVLNGIFGIDISEDDEKSDPLISITYPLKDNLQNICDKLNKKNKK